MKLVKRTLLPLLFLCVMAFTANAQQLGTADFVWSPNPACEGQQVQFTDSSKNFQAPIHDYYFGDGASSSGVANPTHTYALAGTYIVVLSVWDSLTQNFDSTSKQLIVLAGPCSATPDTIRGKVYHDVNANGTFDAGDFALANQIVDFGLFQWGTNTNGEYEFILNAGTYTVSVPNIAPIYTLATPVGGSHTITLTGMGNAVTADFSYTAPVIQDLCVTVQATRFRPGFTRYAWISATNNGTVPANGNLILTYDVNQTFVSSTPATATHTAATREVDFTITNLAPTQTFNGWVSLSLPSTTPLGTPITLVGDATPVMGDADPYNNHVVYQDSVIGSYDPNDKSVSPGYGPDGWVKPDERLFYLIRFQNTGTASAINVEVIDTMTNLLDRATFDMITASHPYNMFVDSVGATHWRFDNINLPDSNSNEPESHGFIRFAINPVAGLADFTEIKNSASIYFDFNAPIHTNTTLTTINSATSISGEVLFGKLDVFPNPATDKVIATFDNANGQAHVFTLSDLQGRTMRHTISNADWMELSVEDLTPGFYLFRLIAEDGRTATGKLVVQ